MKHNDIALKTRSGETVFTGQFPHHAACVMAAVNQNISLDYVDLSGLSLRSCTLDGASLRHADLRGCDLTSANLSECDLRDTLFDMARLVDACLAESRLDRASLRHTQMQAAIMHETSLYRACMTLSTAWAIPWEDVAPRWPVYIETDECAFQPYMRPPLMIRADRKIVTQATTPIGCVII
ncbi:MAG: pentapeptide repeat-containing protein [Pseudomonadota bacterium]